MELTSNQEDYLRS
uniref:Uncharacterized protein n=1 Tax=Rhizophora mucronata TaxID=61149 RepID=A0A2P2PHY4_RHIMU